MMWKTPMPPFIIPPLVKWTLVALGGAAMVHWVVREVKRANEELERAKRFDLRLGLVIVDVPPLLTPDERLHLEDALRKALRGSDVLGLAGAHRVGALLTHTDRSGSTRVVQRLRRELAESVARLRVHGVNVGHAEFSPTCRTADALMLAAVRDAVPVGSA